MFTQEGGGRRTHWKEPRRSEAHGRGQRWYSRTVASRAHTTQVEMGLPNREQLGDSPSMYDMAQFCWQTQAAGIQGLKMSQRWLDDCTDSVMLFIALIVLIGIVVILLGLRICTAVCGKEDGEQPDSQSKKDK